MPQRTGYQRSTASYLKRSYTAPSSEVYSKRVQGKLSQLIKPWIGTPYKWGGSSKSGTDCSGFVMRIMKKYQGLSLPHSTQSSWNMGKSVSRSDLKKGDILFFGSFWQVNHNAIYMGNQEFAHASSSRGVRYDKLSNPYWAPRYKGARRY
jgi:cell wall-associated NlpC family hydrolase